MGVLEDIYESGMFHPLKIETAEYKQALDKVCKAEDELINTYPDCKELFLKSSSLRLFLSVRAK